MNKVWIVTNIWQDILAVCATKETAEIFIKESPIIFYINEYEVLF